MSQPERVRIGIAGLGRLFSGQNAGQALKAVLLAVLLGAVAAWALHQRLDQYVSLMSTPLEQALAQAGRLLLAGLFALALALAVFAALDVPSYTRMSGSARSA